MKRKRPSPREAKAIDAIIAGVLRGFTAKDWKKVFKKMDALKQEQQKQPKIRRAL